MTDDSIAGPVPVPETGPAADPPAPVGEPLTFSSTLKPSSFLGLSLKIALLNFITLTLYRFWGKTEVRRRVWQGVRVNGDAFEYTGRGKELFFGFLFALLVLGLPFLLVLFGLQFAGEIAPLFILPFYIFMPWLWGFGVYSAFRYMASRTTWRGVRFRLGGSATEYGWAFLGYGFLTGLTMGWFKPAADRNLARKIWEDLRFGDRRVRFSTGRSEREGVYGAFALGWFLSVVPYILFIVAVVGYSIANTTMSAVEYPSPAPVPEMPDAALIFVIYGAMLALAPIFLLIWAPYQAAILRSVAAGVTLDDATFRLEVKALPLWWLTVTNLVAILFTLGLLMPWAQARTAHWLIQRLKSTGTARLDDAQQSGTGPKTGEGLADAFGFSLI
ncbi:DUF898 family protein [Rhizobium sp. CRIBSB]|nr:DUF898 family protein [Rhizobium sp. CRIBSB]